MKIHKKNRLKFVESLNEFNLSGHKIVLSEELLYFFENLRYASRTASATLFSQKFKFNLIHATIKNYFAYSYNVVCFFLLAINSFIVYQPCTT